MSTLGSMSLRRAGVIPTPDGVVKDDRDASILRSAISHVSTEDDVSLGGSSDVSIPTRYVEVPSIQWREVQVPKVHLIEVERRVPKIEIVEVERILEVPEFVEVTKEVDKVIEQTITRTVPVRQVVEVPVEVERVVPKIEIVQREQVVEVPGEIIEVPRPYTIEHKRYVPVFQDHVTPTVVTQVARPIFRPVTQNPVQVPVLDYDPYLCKVIIPVPKPVSSTLLFNGKLGDDHRYVRVPPREYNGLVKGLNRHLTDQGLQGLLYLDHQMRPIPPIRQVYNVTVPRTNDIRGSPQNPPPPPELVTGSEEELSETAKEIEQAARGGSSSQSLNSSQIERAFRDPGNQKSWLLRNAKMEIDDGAAAKYYREHHQYFQRKRQTPPQPKTV